MPINNEARSRNVTAVLGPTNTGKTHLAIDRMLGHPSGLIGLPLRLLAREVYDKIAARVGVDKVALITGEEKIKPETARYFVCTVEAMPREIDTDFVAIDEVQLACDPERGHVFTDRLLHARGRQETLLLGAGTMRDAISDLIPGANFISRPRLSRLTYSGQKKITRLPGRTAIVAFSSAEVYAIAELIRRQQGGAAVVLGSLSPRTRNAQVALYQSGDVDYIVATDAIGMGLNLNVEHVALAGIRKFDGQNHRMLTPAELAQVAGRAGRYMNDGTFGVTGDVEPLDNELVERLEGHVFEPAKVLQWRGRKLDFSSLDGLRDSLRQSPNEARLVRARMADDVIALESVSGDREIMELARGQHAVSLLWDVCQVPDYRKISNTNHAELVATIYKSIAAGSRKIDEDWFAKQVAFADRVDGDIDTLSNRLSHIRTWTFVSNRADWLKDPVHWQERTRAIEDALSDAMHERLTQRFVDAKTSALMKGMRLKEELNADIADDGAIRVENHPIGRLKGFRFTPEAQGEGIHGKASRNAATQVLSKELAMRARRVASAKSDAFKLSRSCKILWRDEEIARLEAGDDPLKPQVILLVDEHLQGPDKEKVQERLNTWMAEQVSTKLKPLVEISKADDVVGLARGIAFRMTENFGVLKRESVAEEMKSLDQPGRAQLRKYGVRFGAFNVYFPLLLKPAAAELRLVLWLLKSASSHGLSLDQLPEPPRPGLTSLIVDKELPEPFYRACGYHLCGPRAVRMDILERLADLIRPLIAWRAPPDNPSATPPKGATGDGAFFVIPEMMSILGCSPEELGEVLKTLGFWNEKRVKKTAPKPSVATVAATTAPDASSDVSLEVSADGSAGEPVLADAVPPGDAAQLATAEASGQDVVVAAVLNTEVAAEPQSAEVVASTDAPSGVTVEGGPTADDAPLAEPAIPSVMEPALEPVMEDVWRPRRRGREAHHRPERQKREEGAASDSTRGDRPKRGRRRPTEGYRAREPIVVAAVVEGVASANGGDDPATGPVALTAKPERGDRKSQRRDGEQKPQKKADDANRGYRAREDKPEERDTKPKGGDQRRPPGGDQARGDRARGDRARSDRDRGDRPRGGEQRGREERRVPMNVVSSAPTKKAGAIDPDSPFAKLMALREAMGKGASDPSSKG
jgi:ATP-dependent RNA helicase SUPV3L1/SUV3